MHLPFLALLALTQIISATANFKSRCESLSSGVKVQGYNGIKVNKAAYVTQNTTFDQFAEGTNVTCALPITTVPVDICRVALNFPTEGNGEVYMEAWLPEKWNSRFLAVGTGGLAGCIFYNELAFQVQYGYAAVASNSGHNGTSAGAFLNQPDVLEDFVFRALYASTVVGKAVTKQFYRKAHKKAYFIGCSQGGRHGFQAAQDHPELFDGIVVGAPGLRLPGLFQHMTRWQLQIGQGGNMSVSTEKWGAVQNETLRQCDYLDGARDGIVEDTRRCKPDLTTLRCGNNTSPTCLTPRELAVIAQFFSPWTVNNTLIYPGMTHNGAELLHASTLSGAEPLIYALEWPRYVLYNDASWTLDRWTPADAVFAVRQNPYGMNALKGDLSGVRNRGAKIIHYHGLIDELLDSSVSDGYYEHVLDTMRASPKQLDKFYRYFRVAGLAHCAGGTGASSLGQGAFAVPASAETRDNVLSQVVEWVEGGKAPDTLRGSKFVGGDVAKGVEYSRGHCRYPARNVYKGKGDGRDEKGWQCVV